MSKIVTYSEQRYSMIKLDSGERIMLTLSQAGIVIFQMHLLGVVPGQKIAEWLPQDLDRYVDLFGGEHPNGSPFRFAVEKLASFKSIKELRAYLMQRH